MKWLNTFFENIAETIVLPEHAPKKEILENEKVLGEVPTFFQQMAVHHASIGTKIMDVVKEHTASHERPGEDHDCDGFYKRVNALQEEADLISKIFWVSLRVELGIENVSRVALRKGWKVVELPPKEESSILNGSGILVVGVGPIEI